MASIYLQQIDNNLYLEVVDSGEGWIQIFIRSSPSVNVISFEDTGKDGRDEVICNCKIFLIALFINFIT